MKVVGRASAAPPSAVAQFSAEALALSAAPSADGAAIRKSGRATIDALLAGGSRWFHTSGASGDPPSAGAAAEVSFSFIDDSEGLSGPDAAGFQPLSETQRQRVRDALGHIASLVNLRFSEVASGGDIQYAANQQSVSAGYARYPGEGSRVMISKNQAGFEGEWARGSYEWQVLLHESAHALGLKHPGKYNAGGGSTPGPYLPKALDNRNNTLMSYNDAANMKRVVAEGGGFRSSRVHADTLQAFDIAALQYLYGAPAQTEAATYQWETDAMFSQTLWNPNADSSIDLSNQSLDNIVDLRPGRFSSIGLRDAYAETGLSAVEFARLKSGGKSLKSVLGVPGYTGRNNLRIAEGSQIHRAVGGSGNDTFIASSGRDTLDGGAGNDAFFLGATAASVSGGDGNDTAYLKKVAGATWALASGQAQLRRNAKGGNGEVLATVALDGVEQVRLWNGAKLKALGKPLAMA